MLKIMLLAIGGFVTGHIIAQLPMPYFLIALMPMLIRLWLHLEVARLPYFYLTKEYQEEALERFNKKPKYIRYLILRYYDFAEAESKLLDAICNKGEREQ